LGPLGTAATNWPTVPAPGDYDDGEKFVEWLARETEVLAENLPQCRFVHHKPHMLWQDANQGRRGGKPATNNYCFCYVWTSYLVKGREQYFPVVEFLLISVNKLSGDSNSYPRCKWAQNF
jgi:hypothetical protein